MDMKTNRGLNWRALNTFIAIISFLVLPFSGFVLHEVAMSSDIRGMHFAMTVHNTAAVIFIISMTMHLAHNRRHLGNYLRKNGKEIVVSITAVALVIALGALHVFHAG